MPCCLNKIITYIVYIVLLFFFTNAQEYTWAKSAPKNNKKISLKQQDSNLLTTVLVLAQGVVAVFIAICLWKNAADSYKSYKEYNRACENEALPMLWSVKIDDFSGGWYAYPSTDLLFDHDDACLYCLSSSNQRIYKINRDTGEIVWTTESLCLAPEKISWTNSIKNVLSIHKKKDKNFYVGGGLVFSQKQKESRIIALSPIGNMVVFDKKTGVLLKKIQTNEIARKKPFFCDMKLMFVNNYNDLFCFDENLLLNYIIPHDHVRSSWIQPLQQQVTATWMDYFFIAHNDGIDMFDSQGKICEQFSVMDMFIKNKEILQDNSYYADDIMSIVVHGSYLIAYFPMKGLFCWNIETKKLCWWQKVCHALKPLSLCGDRIVMHCQKNDENIISSFDIKTGDLVWTKNVYIVFDHIQPHGPYIYLFKDYRVFFMNTQDGVCQNIYYLENIPASVSFVKNSLLYTYNTNSSVSCYDLSGIQINSNSEKNMENLLKTEKEKIV